MPWPIVKLHLIWYFQIQVEFLSLFFQLCFVFFYSVLSRDVCIFGLVKLALFDRFWIIVISIFTDIVKDHYQRWMVLWICLRVKAIQGKQHQIHCVNSCISDPVCSIWHDTLNEWVYTFTFIFNDRSEGFDCFDKDTLVRSVDIRVIEPGSIVKGNFSYCAHLNAWSHSLQRIHAFELTRMFFASIIVLCNCLCNFVQKCRFSLSTFPKNCSSPPVLRVVALMIKFLYGPN